MDRLPGWPVYASALSAFGAGCVVSGVAAAWVSAYLWPSRDPKFAQSPDVVFQLGLIGVAVMLSAALASGAVGVLLSGQGAPASPRRWLVLCGAGMAYAAIFPLLDAVCPGAVVLYWLHLLLVPAAAIAMILRHRRASAPG